MSLRLCTHIKTNGIKCGSPALRHHTLCYFHYQWQRRDQRRIRLGGPVGMNKNSGIELPLLDGPEAILVSIMEIQRGLLDHRLEIKKGTALLYSLQLALQARISSFGLGHSGSVRECPELDMDLELERAKAQRPSKEKCARCPKQETCISPKDCKKLPKLPAGYRREGDHLVRDAADASTQPCHSERSAAASRGVEEPFVSSPEAPVLETVPTPEKSTSPLRESSPAGDCGETAPTRFPPSRAHARRQMPGAPHLPQLADVGSGAVEGPASRSSVPPIFGSSVASPNSYSHCILKSNSNPLIDLARKFPQLVESTREQI